MKTETSTFHTVIVGTSYSLVALIAVRALTIISSVVVARLLGRTNLGMVAIVNNVTNLVSLFAALGIPTAITKYVAQHAATEPDSIGAVIGTGLGLLLPPLILLGALLFGASGWIAVRFYHEPMLTPLLRITACVLIIGALGSGGLGQALLQGLKRIRTISLINIVTSSIGLPVVVGLTFLFRVTGNIVSQLVIALVGAGLILTAIVRIRRSRSVGQASEPVLSSSGVRLDMFPASPGVSQLMPFGPIRFERRLVRGLLNVSIPAFLAGLVMTPALWFTTTRLSQLRGFGEVGLFNICFAAFQMILFIPMAVGMPLIPLIAESWATNPQATRRLMQSAIDGVSFVTCVLAAALSSFAHPLIGLLYGSGYTDATPAMTLISAAAFLSSLGFVLGHYFAGTGKMWAGMGFNLVWFAALIGLSFPTIARMGATGLALDFWLSYLIMTAAILFYARRVVGLRVRYPTILCVLSAGAAALSLLATRHLQGPALWTVRAAILAVVAAAGYWLLPAKTELRRGLEYLRSSIGNRLRHAQ